MSYKHTPGPWHFHHDHGWLVVESENGDLYIKIEKGSSAKKHLADASLIAAAPELLSCLVEMLEVHDEPCRFDHHGYCQSHFLDDVNDGGCRVANARSAIAKATGEQ